MPFETAVEHAPRLDIRELALSRRSTPQASWGLGEIMPLTAESLTEVLAIHPGAPDPKAPLSRISAPHHMLAKLLAEGKDPIAVSHITGYTPARIRTLQNDPAFGELIAHYETETVMAEANITAQVQHLALTAAQLLQERLELEPEEFSSKELQSLMNSGLDRTGYGTSTRVDVKVTDTAKVLAELRSSAPILMGQVIDRSAELDPNYSETIHGLAQD